MKKSISFLLTTALLLCLFSGCGKKAEPQTPPASSAPTETADTETRIITDGVGRQVELPAAVSTIVPLCNTPRMITYLGLSDKVVGIEQCEHAKSPIMAYAYVNIERWKELPNVGNNALGASEWYAEELVACAPDVILCNYDKDTADSIQRQTGIPTVAVSQGTLFGEDYKESLRILADVCGVSERAELLISFIDECLLDLEGRTKSISGENKPLVLGAGATFKGGHSIDGVYSNYPVFSILSANDAAVGISDTIGGLLVDKEQILAWDPDMIFFDSGSMELVKTDYAADSSYFNQLKAVKNGELYQWPNSTWHWSNVEIPLVSCYYVGTLLYPEVFADVDFEAKAAEIFDIFLGEPDYLSVLEQAGAGYGKVSLGS